MYPSVSKSVAIGRRYAKSMAALIIRCEKKHIIRWKEKLDAQQYRSRPVTLDIPLLSPFLFFLFFFQFDFRNRFLLAPETPLQDLPLLSQTCRSTQKLRIPLCGFFHVSPYFFSLQTPSTKSSSGGGNGSTAVLLVSVWVGICVGAVNIGQDGVLRGGGWGYICSSVFYLRVFFSLFFYGLAVVGVLNFVPKVVLSFPFLPQEIELRFYA